MPKESETLSKQQLKSLNTKKKIYRATKNILKRDGYRNLSVKNICLEAEVSNGSFFHHFKSKDELLSYYMEEQPAINPDLLDVPSDAGEAKIAIIHVYLSYAQYCMELGLDFISHYFTPDNAALDPDNDSGHPYPIVSVENYLKKAVDAGVIAPKLSLDLISTDIRMLVIGNIFEWCLRKGNTDFESNIRRSLTHYLDGIL